MSEIFTMGEPMVVFIAEKPGTFSEVEIIPGDLPVLS